MSAKLLVFLGVLLAHCAVAAGWDRQLPKQQVRVAASCVRAPAELPSFTPPREIYAMANPMPSQMAVMPIDDEVMQR